jgi:hypothetical protein
MELHRPKEEKTPFVCQLTFTAAGGVHGDIVQVRDLQPPLRAFNSVANEWSHHENHYLYTFSHTHIEDMMMRE